jgi:hypothetical protein
MLTNYFASVDKGEIQKPQTILGESRGWPKSDEAHSLPMKRSRNVSSPRLIVLVEPGLQIERRAFAFLRRKRMLFFMRRIGRPVFSRFLPTDTASLDRGGRCAVRRR